MVEEVRWNENLITARIYTLADEYGLSPKKAKQIVETVRCESRFKVDAVGDGGKSFGLVQIHLPSWRGQITKQKALDPDYALEFITRKFSEGSPHLWTCWRLLYGV